MRRAHTREQERDFAGFIVNDRITVHWPGIGFSWRRYDGALPASQCKIPDDFQLAVPCPQNARGLECQHGLIRRVRDVAGRHNTLRAEYVPPVLIRRIDTKIEERG